MAAQFQCPNYHMMMSFNPNGCNIQQNGNVSLDKQDEVPYLIYRINVLITFSPNLVDQLKTMNSVNSIFSQQGWITYFTFNSNSINFNAHWNNGTGTPINFNTDMNLFDIVWNGDNSPPQYSHSYPFQFFAPACFIDCSSILLPTQTTCYPIALANYNLFTPIHAPVNILGNVKYENNKASNSSCSDQDNFPDLVIQATMGTTILASQTTPMNGNYAFNTLQPLCQYEIRPVSPTQPHNCGVTQADINAVRNLVLGIIGGFPQTWNYIAADANLSGTYTNADIVKITNVLLGGSFPKNFRFPTDDAYNNYIPWSGVNFFDFGMVNPLLNSTNTINFHGVKVGDVARIDPNSGALDYSRGDCDICTVSLQDPHLETRESKKEELIILPEEAFYPNIEKATPVRIKLELSKEDPSRIDIMSTEVISALNLSIRLTNQDFKIVSIESNGLYHENSYIIEKNGQSIKWIWLRDLSRPSGEKIGSIVLNKAGLTLDQIQMDKNLRYNYVVNEEEKEQRIALTLIGENSSPLEIYPNPVSGQEIQLHVEKIMDGSYPAKIVDSRGALLYAENLTFKSERASMALQNDIPSGIYILHLQVNHKNVSARFVVK